MGNYYGNYYFYGLPVSSSVSFVNYNWTSQTTGKSDMSFVAARLVGLIRPAYTETYQIQVAANVGDEIALWINGQMKLNASTLRQSANTTDELNYGTSFVCTYAMTANSYFDIRLEYVALFPLCIFVTSVFPLCIFVTSVLGTRTSAGHPFFSCSGSLPRSPLRLFPRRGCCGLLPVHRFRHKSSSHPPRWALCQLGLCHQVSLLLCMAMASPRVLRVLRRLLHL